MTRTKGFTLIELLIVITIIGIIAAVALPQYSVYRQRGFDARANSDLRNAATAEEAYYTTFQKYVDVTVTGPASPAELPGLSVSDTVELEMVNQDDVSYTGTASSTTGTGKVFRFDSEKGGMQN
jgi:prepilin-type N-terminal cleavage/methylation domain-containing protein